MLWKILYLVVLLAACSSQLSVEEPHDELFRYYDKNNDTRLTASECQNFWLHFDGDGDHVIGKLEFELKWTFLNLRFAHYTPLFFRHLDTNFDAQIDAKEVTSFCNYFDDDDDGHISLTEFDMNWTGLFTFPTGH
ncbi:uncharacterized protein LOC124146772 [Haliotis rufescens]|uniref:uncharacterized protein LOC124146772 n=1 Tax=Haliotis rufescens TaxID=6454 RepID=UPI001EAFBBBC|nr:uncharacterized protein LOC124146772 [Haliotis rufescens]